MLPLKLAIRSDILTAMQSKTPEYRAWRAMIQRCSDTNTPYYHRYGGRGIRVCHRWRTSFASFIKDVGIRPSSQHSLDRFPEKNGNYEPGNVRWATRKEQQQNIRTNCNVTHDGETLCAAEWGRRFKVSPVVISLIARLGCTIDHAIRCGVLKPRVK